jgi:tRNA A-37 threonylcarbamoyl transferase component Bud32
MTPNKFKFRIILSPDTQTQRLRKTEIIQEAVLKLAKLHDIGILYGDIHTSNIMLDNNGQVYFIDFDNSQTSDAIPILDGELTTFCIMINMGFYPHLSYLSEVCNYKVDEILLARMGDILD